MSTNTLQLTRANNAPVSSALQELVTAASHLFAALSDSLFKTAAPRSLTVFDEAEQVRKMAEAYADSDRGFAADLFAAADRHEMANSAK